jgi:hypothetical protein
MGSRSYVPCLHLAKQSFWLAAPIRFIEHDVDNAGRHVREHAVG